VEIAGKVASFIANSQDRFATVVGALSVDDPQACCSRDRKPVRKVEVSLIRALDPTGRAPIAASNPMLQSWIESSWERWVALADLFDDERPHNHPFPERSARLRGLLRRDLRDTLSSEGGDGPRRT
jgi:hypothetical protein